ncbi:hypothetical protein PBY51_013648 [Eleginops maclovinus]|uniref:Uncharacterized protein n=1 Tax=Eleginops maclovinus TaxID=56733 RepID=A0AAN8AX67_ELEMC|nr:hypothetical protein PBY51_013648 [Eleginops maclovinus]
MQLTQEFLGLTLVVDYTKPRVYTGELIGMVPVYPNGHSRIGIPMLWMRLKRPRRTGWRRMSQRRFVSFHTTTLSSYRQSHTVPPWHRPPRQDFFESSSQVKK